MLVLWGVVLCHFGAVALYGPAADGSPTRCFRCSCWQLAVPDCCSLYCQQYNAAEAEV